MRARRPAERRGRVQSRAPGVELARRAKVSRLIRMRDISRRRRYLLARQIRAARNWRAFARMALFVLVFPVRHAGVLINERQTPCVPRFPLSLIPYKLNALPTCWRRSSAKATPTSAFLQTCDAC